MCLGMQIICIHLQGCRMEKIPSIAGGFGNAASLVAGTVEVAAEGVTAESVLGFGALSGGVAGTTTAGGSLFTGLLSEKSTVVGSSKKKHQNKNYETILSFLINQLRPVSKQSSSEKESFYMREKMLLGLHKEYTVKSEESPLLRCFPESSKKLIEERILYVQSVQNIREVLMRQLFIAVVGPQNSGKSLLMEKLWGSKVKVIVSECNHTEHATAFNITDNVIVVDYPGLNSLEKQHRETFSRSRNMNSIFIAVIKYPGGDLDQDTFNTLKKVREVAKLSKVLKVVYCFNRCASSVASWREEGITADSMKDHYFRQLRKLEENAGTTSPMERILAKNDFYFTDWKDSDQGRDLGIIGADEIKGVLNHTLRKLNLINSEEL